jgi:hypothetical protein
MKEPELIIGYEGKGIAAAAACTMCGEFMPEKGPAVRNGKKTIARFQEDFKLHARIKHQRYRVN